MLGGRRALDLILDRRTTKQRQDYIWIISYTAVRVGASVDVVIVGAPVGGLLGESLGELDGELLGESLGELDGELLGESLGELDG